MNKFKLSKTKLAILCMLVSALGYSIMQIFVKMSGNLPACQKVFFRNLFPAVLSFITLYKTNFFSKGIFVKQVLPSFSKLILFLLALRSIAGTIGAIFNFYAYDHLPAIDAAVIFKTTPLFLVIICFFFLKETMTKKEIIAIVIAFIGVLVISLGNTQGNTGADVNWLGYLSSLTAAVLASIAYACVRALGKLHVDGSLIIFVFSLTSSLVMGVWLLFVYEPMQKQQFFYLCVSGLGACLGQYGLTWAYKLEQPSKIGLFDYSNVIFSSILGILLLNDYPSGYAICGGAIVFIALVISVKDKIGSG